MDSLTQSSGNKYRSDGRGHWLRASRRGKSRGSGNGRFLWRGAGCHEDVLDESLTRQDGQTKTAAQDEVLSYDARGISNHLHGHDDVDGVILPLTPVEQGNCPSRKGSLHCGIRGKASIGRDIRPRRPPGPATGPRIAFPAASTSQSGSERRYEACRGGITRSVSAGG